MTRKRLSVAAQLFMKHTELRQFVAEHLDELDEHDVGDLTRSCEAIFALLKNAEKDDAHGSREKRCVYGTCDGLSAKHRRICK